MTTRRTAGRLAAAATASSLVLLSASPAAAAEPVAQASATALEVTIAGTATDSDTFTATNDGTGEQTSGTSEPAITVLGGQSFLRAGTLAQDAVTRIEGRTGASAACAGLAGDGATLAEVGDGACLFPRQNVELDAGTVDLSDVELVRSELLAGLDEQLRTALQPVLDPLLAGLQGALEQVLAGADAGVFLDAGAVQSYCVARPGDVTADSTLADAGLTLRLGGQEVTLVSLPVDPAPNTRVVTDLGKVAEMVVEALRTQFEEAINGVLGPLNQALDQTAVLTAALGQVSDQLAPLEENVLEVILNKQELGQDEITVTALDLQALPASEQAGVELLGVEIGRSSCGPNGRVQPAAPQEPGTPAPQPQEQVPTAVPAGSSDTGLGTGALLALLVTAVGAGTLAARRSLRG